MGETILTQIIRSIADAEEVDPENLDISLQDYVETDAIRDLVNHESNAWRLQFETSDHIIEVTGNVEILVDGTQARTLN